MKNKSGKQVYFHDEIMNVKKAKDRVMTYILHTRSSQLSSILAFVF